MQIKLDPETSKTTLHFTCHICFIELFNTKKPCEIKNPMKTLCFPCFNRLYEDSLKKSKWCVHGFKINETCIKCEKMNID